MGTTNPTTARAIIATRLIKEAIKSEKKITLQFNKDLQNSLQDPYAQQLSKDLIKIVEENKKDFLNKFPDRQEQIISAVNMLKTWSCEITAADKEPLVYTVWIEKLLDTLLQKHFQISFERTSITSSFVADHFFGHYITNWAKGEEINSDLCENNENAMESKKCIYNVFLALVNTFKYLESQLGHDEVNIYN